jgi:hypothetical protein
MLGGKESSLELLQVMIQRVLDEVVAFRTESREMRQRLGMLERQVGFIGGNEAEHYASLSVRLDDVVSRLERIERRLDLVEAPSK